MYLDQNIIDTATPKQYQIFLSLLYFHLLKSSEGMKFDFGNKVDLDIVTIPDGFSSTIRKARPIATHVYLTFRCNHTFLVLYFNPDSMVSRPEHERSTYEGSLFSVKRFRVTFSFYSHEAPIIIGEDYLELFRLLKVHNILDQIETELERIKLLGA